MEHGLELFDLPEQGKAPEYRRSACFAYNVATR